MRKAQIASNSSLEAARDQLSSEQSLRRRIVELIWFIPLFLEWQKERVLQTGVQSEKFDNFVGTITTLIEDTLGMP